MRRLMRRPLLSSSLLLAGLMFYQNASADGTAESVEDRQYLNLDADRPTSEHSRGRSKRAAPKQNARLWQANTVYYSLDRAEDGTKKVIQAAIEEIERESALRFVVRTDEPDYIDVVTAGPDHPTCGNSNIGRVGGRQQLIIQRGVCENKHVALHELMHALGFGHEHQRGDRNQHVVIAGNSCNDPNDPNTSIDGSLDTSSPYDTGSIMHYAGIRVRNPGEYEELNTKQWNILSQGDIDALNKLYPGKTDIVQAPDPNKNGPVQPPSFSPKEVNLIGEDERETKIILNPGSYRLRPGRLTVNEGRGSNKITWRYEFQPNGEVHFFIKPLPGNYGQDLMSVELGFDHARPQIFYIPIYISLPEPLHFSPKELTFIPGQIEEAIVTLSAGNYPLTADHIELYNIFGITERHEFLPNGSIRYFIKFDPEYESSIALLDVKLYDHRLDVPIDGSRLTVTIKRPPWGAKAWAEANPTKANPTKANPTKVNSTEGDSTETNPTEVVNSTPEVISGEVDSTKEFKAGPSLEETAPRLSVKTRQLVSQVDGLCLEALDDGHSWFWKQGERTVGMRACRANAMQQQWQHKTDEIIVNQAYPDKCLAKAKWTDTQPIADAENSYVALAQCSGANNQKWIVDANMFINKANPELALMQANGTVVTKHGAKTASRQGEDVVKRYLWRWQ